MSESEESCILRCCVRCCNIACRPHQLCETCYACPDEIDALLNSCKKPDDNKSLSDSSNSSNGCAVCLSLCFCYPFIAAVGGPVLVCYGATCGCCCWMPKKERHKFYQSEQTTRKDAPPKQTMQAEPSAPPPYEET